MVMPGIVRTDFARNAKGAPPPGPAVPGGPTSPLMQPQTAEEVAEAIAQLLHHPAPELYTNPASDELAQKYFADVAAFERRGTSR